MFHPQHGLGFSGQVIQEAFFHHSLVQVDVLANQPIALETLLHNPHQVFPVEGFGDEIVGAAPNRLDGDFYLSGAVLSFLFVNTVREQPTRSRGLLLDGSGSLWKFPVFFPLNGYNARVCGRWGRSTRTAPLPCRSRVPANLDVSRVNVIRFLITMDSAAGF